MSSEEKKNGGVDLSVDIGGVLFQSPVFLASGTAGYGDELSEILDFRKIGAVVTKGISPAPREGNPTPRIAEFYADGKAIALLNSIGLQNPGARSFAREIMPSLGKIREKGTKIIVNVFGEKEDDYAEVIKIIESESEPDGYELNLSCPNTTRGGIEFGVSRDSVGKIVGSCRKETKRPVVVKFSPFSEILPPLVETAVVEGADAITLTNTIPSAVLDWKVGFFKGGMSGYPLKPIALRCVIDVKEKLPDVKIIGCGGIYTGQDAFEFILAGACAVQVGTATFSNPKTPEKIADELREKVKRSGKNFHELIGSGIIKVETG